MIFCCDTSVWMFSAFECSFVESFGDLFGVFWLDSRKSWLLPGYILKPLYRSEFLLLDKILKSYRFVSINIRIYIWNYSHLTFSWCKDSYWSSVYSIIKMIFFYYVYLYHWITKGKLILKYSFLLQVSFAFLFYI